LAPPNVRPAPLGEADAEADRLSLAETEAEGDLETDGLTLLDGLGERLTEALGLLIISRTANVTIAASSLVAFVPPTGLLPCPGVVSIKTHAHWPPTSINGPAVLLAPAVGGV